MSSLFLPEDLFTTNRAPSDEEHKKLARLVAEHENRIGLLTRQIASLQAEKTALLGALAPLKRAISPFRRLPDDVVREIFVACLDRTRNSTMAHTEAPVLLTRISSYTRRLALASPELWAALHIPIIPSRPSHADNEAIMAARVRGVEEWLLRRSGAVPLRISVHEPCDYQHPPTADWNSPFTRQIVAVLLQCCTRWQDVSFLLVSIPSVRRIAALTAADCPLLRSVSLRGQFNVLHLETDAWKDSHLFDGPALQKFSTTLVEPGDGAPIHNFIINWANITHLHLHGTYSNRQQVLSPAFRQTFTTTLTSILREATRLVSLDIHVIPTVDIGGDIYLPFLKVLKASQEYEDAVAHFRGILGQIRAPQLETIVYIGDLYGEIPPPSLIAILAHATKVQEMSITLIDEGDMDVVSDSSVYIPIIALCPLLKSLYIGDSGTTIAATNLLCSLAGDTEVDGGRQLCPELEYFHCDSTLIVSPEALYHFFKRKHDDLSGRIRWKSVVLRVHFRHNYPPPDYAEFHRLSSGINLRLIVKNLPPTAIMSQIKRPLDEGANFLSDKWSPDSSPSFPLPLHAGFDCVIDGR